MEQYVEFSWRRLIFEDAADGSRTTSEQSFDIGATVTRPVPNAWGSGFLVSIEECKQVGGPRNFDRKAKTVLGPDERAQIDARAIALAAGYHRPPAHKQPADWEVTLGTEEGDDDGELASLKELAGDGLLTEAETARMAELETLKNATT